MLSLNDYLALFNQSQLTSNPDRLHELDLIANAALFYRSIYETVEKGTTIPWYIVAAIHFRESNQNFKCHLHNGDPLSERTVHVPRGRPLAGTPPFTWIESAVDAFHDKWIPRTWSIPICLEFIEQYNGLGYQKHGVYSPYLWNYTNQYTKGLYVADGRFNPDKIEIRPGCVAILKTLAQKGVAFDFSAFLAAATSLH